MTNEPIATLVRRTADASVTATAEAMQAEMTEIIKAYASRSRK